jgi:hypothetical protein
VTHDLHPEQRIDEVFIRYVKAEQIAFGRCSSIGWETVRFGRSTIIDGHEMRPAFCLISEVQSRIDASDWQEQRENLRGMLERRSLAGSQRG